MPYLLCIFEMILCDQSEDILRKLRRYFEKVFARACKRRDLKIKVDKSKLMVVGEESPYYEFMFDEQQLDKYQSLSI